MNKIFGFSKRAKMVEAALTGLLVGLLGSFHCVGMCGPLALALPISHKTPSSRRGAIIAYNLGRVLTYACLGLVLGFIGSKVVLAGYQQWFSITAGVFILVVVIIGKIHWQVSWMQTYQGKLKKAIVSQFKAVNGPRTFFTIGILNGLLPCGMVYLAITSALLFGQVWVSALFMAAFGLGTLPLMALLMATGHRLSFSFRQKISQWMPYMVMVLGLLMILRGMNLGIPYISPGFSGLPNSQTIDCHPVMNP